jgi:hypothetical protein
VTRKRSVDVRILVNMEYVYMYMMSLDHNFGFFANLDTFSGTWIPAYAGMTETED